MTISVLEMEAHNPRKKPRTHIDHPINSSSHSPSLFAPFRALGLVTNHVPFALQTRSFKGASDGPRTHILTCLGRSWALWEGEKMTLLFAGSDAGASISSVAFDGDAIWASAGSFSVNYIRGKEVFRLQDPLEKNISSIMVFGAQLLTLCEDGHRLVVWDTDTSEPNGTIIFPPDFTATKMLHPATYINKIVITSTQGSMQLWNIRSRTCIHTFAPTSILKSPSSSASITALSQSPAIDVLGIGFQTGDIVLYDIRADERMMRMFMEGGSIQALAFRTDGHPILAAASSTGHIALWDLNSGGRIVHIIRGAHDSAVTAISWLPNQPVLISSGDDNSVKQWLFESPTAPPRLLKFRSGHQQPPHLIRYYGDDGKQILTASRDKSLRCTSVVRDSRSFEMSQGSLAKQATALSTALNSLKIPAATALAYSATRSKNWDDVLTSHVGETFARTWTVPNKRLGSHTLTPTPVTKGRASGVKSVCVTACGNFGLGGTSDGTVEMWNLESGAKRKTFRVGVKTKGSRRTDGCTVTGVATDSLNRLVIATTLEGTVNFFDFHTTTLEQTLPLRSGAVSVVLSRRSGLLGVVCDDMVVRIVDIETRKVVRELSGFCGRILDITFSPDSRWLIATSLDSVVRTFDIPTGRLIDAFRTSSVATSLTFSPTGDFLATAHVDSVGVFLWANRAQYAEVMYRSINEDALVDVSVPSMQELPEDETLNALAAMKLDGPAADVFSTPDQLDSELLTLTLLPRARWQTLLNLDVIQQRNKPKEAPKVPEKAPFFLPTLPGVEHRFALQDAPGQGKSRKSTRRLDQNFDETRSIFLKLCSEGSEDHYESLFVHIKTLLPAALDLELRSLVSIEHMKVFISALIARLRSRRDFEAIQSLQNVFLKIHGETLILNQGLQPELQILLQVQQEESKNVLELLASSLGTLGFVRDVL